MDYVRASQPALKHKGKKDVDVDRWLVWEGVRKCAYAKMCLQCVHV